MATAGLIDPTKTGKYPVILSDALLGRTSNEIFTGIRYNHKPALTSSSAPSSARLKPSQPGKTSSYDLAFNDGEGKYSFSGTRNTDDNQYVLYFDPEKQAFILDRVDSTFNLNVTSLPNNTDRDNLSRQYPPIDTSPAPKAPPRDVTKPAEPVKAAPKPRAKPAQKKEVKRKPEKKQAPKNIALSLPTPEPAKPKPPPQAKRNNLEDDEDEDEDDDGGLLVEYPDGGPKPTRQTDFSPAFPSVRRFDDFMNARESEGDDADGEGEDEDEAEYDFKLGSPVNNHVPPQQPYHQEEPQPMDQDEDDIGADLEDDLEKQLEIAFEEVENSQSGSPDGDESEISEED